MIWRLLLVAGKRFRKIDAPHLAAEVYRGAVFEDGVKITTKSATPASFGKMVPLPALGFLNPAPRPRA